MCCSGCRVGRIGSLGEIGVTWTVYLDRAYVGATNDGGFESPVGSSLTLGDAGNFGASGSIAQAAVYPTGLSAGRISAHWMAGASTVTAACPAAPTSPYAKGVLADSPADTPRLSRRGAGALSGPGCGCSWQRPQCVHNAVHCVHGEDGASP